MKYQMCTRCVMDTTDPDIRFDEKGVCNHCHDYDEVYSKTWFRGAEGATRLQAAVDEMKAYGKGKEYDCIIGLSGGADSSYLAYLGHHLGLRMLAVHVDAGWNSELAVKNIENICSKLKIDLVTEVIDWKTMRELQRAFFKARVVNQDIPQDHAFFAALYKYAVKNKIKYVLHGSNVSSESILPAAWRGFNALDSVHLKDVFRKNSDQKLENFPTVHYLKVSYYYPRVVKMKVMRLLDYVDYNKAEAVKVLQEKLDWRDYGAKHHESRFTKFHQAYFLPQKFGFDKRKAHLSSLILAGQLTREEALAELEKPAYHPEELQEDIDYIAKKLKFSKKEFEDILAMPPGRHEDYAASQTSTVKTINLIKRLLGK